MEKMLILTIHEVLQMCNRVLQAGAIKDIWPLSLQRKKIGQIRAVKDWSPHALEECVCIHPTWAWRREVNLAWKCNFGGAQMPEFWHGQFSRMLESTALLPVKSVLKYHSGVCWQSRDTFCGLCTDPLNVPGNSGLFVSKWCVCWGAAASQIKPIKNCIRHIVAVFVLMFLCPQPGLSLSVMVLGSFSLPRFGVNARELQFVFKFGCLLFIYSQIAKLWALTSSLEKWGKLESLWLIPRLFRC